MAAAMSPAAEEAPRPPCVRPQGRLRPCIRGTVARGRDAPLRRAPAPARRDREAEIALMEGCDSDEEVILGCSSNFVSGVFGLAMEEVLDDDDEWLVSVDDAREQPAESLELRAEMPALPFKPSVGTWLLQKPRGPRPAAPPAEQDARVLPAAAAQPASVAPAPPSRALPWQLRPSVGTWALRTPPAVAAPTPAVAEEAAAPAAVARPLLPQHRPSVATWLLPRATPRAFSPPVASVKDAAACILPCPTGCPVAFGPRTTEEATPVCWEDMGCEDGEAPTWEDLGGQENRCSTMPEPPAATPRPRPAVAWESLGNDEGDLWEACLRQQEPAPAPAAAPAAPAAHWFLRPSVSTWMLPAPRAPVAAPAAAPAAEPEAAVVRQAVTSPTWSHGARRLIFRDERSATQQGAEQAAAEPPASPAMSQRSRARLLGLRGETAAAAQDLRGEQPSTGNFVSSKRELKMLLTSEDSLARLTRSGRGAAVRGLSAMEMDLRAGSASSPNPAFSAAGLSMASQVPVLPSVHKKAAGLEGAARSSNLRLAGTGIVGGARTWGLGGRS